MPASVPPPRRGQSRRSGPSSRHVFGESLESRRLFDGLTGQYFNRVDHTELVTTRTDATVDFTWAASPATGVNADKFSVRWTGQVQAPATAVYTFYTLADDGVRLWVDGRLLVDNWVNQGSTERSGQVSLEAGRRYDVRMDYYEFDLGARANLSWSYGAVAKQTVPSSALFASPGGLSATYYNGVGFTQPALRRTDATLDFNWPTGQPDPAVAADGFSVRWSGYLVPEFSETYSFRLNAVAASVIRLKIDGATIVDPSSLQSWNRLSLEAGKRYPITIDYADPAGAAGATLQWSSPSRPLQTVPNSRLLAGAATSIPTQRVTYTNPITTFDAPDPGLIRADGAYWMVHTMGGPDVGWPLWKSLDGVNWTFQKHLLTAANKPSWMQKDFWAPEIHKVGSKFVLTGTARDSRTGELVIAMASSPTIDGTYAVRSEPLVTTPVAVLDSTIFQDDDGRQYLIWKRDSAAHTGTHGSIRIRELDATGLEWAAGSAERTILDNETDSWEKFLAEAPFLVKRDDFYYLFYSGAFIDTTYKVGVARSSNLTGLFTRNAANPVIGNNAAWSGPGHGAFAFDLDGTLWHLFHARRTSDPDAGRVQVLDPVVWTAGGWPTFAGNGVSSTAKPGPRVAAAQGAGLLTVTGDAVAGSADTIRLVRSGADSSQLDIYVNEVLSQSAPFAEVQKITINAGAGDDVLRLDFTNGDVLPGGGLAFAGGTGTLDTIQIVAPDGSVDADFRHTADGAFALGSGLFTSSGVERLRIDGGTHRALVALPGRLQMTAGSLSLSQPQTFASIDLTGTASLTLAGVNRVLRTNAFSIANDARLDLGDGAMIIDYAAGGLDPLNGVVASLRTARANGAWTGKGVTSSTAAASGGQGTLGYMEAADYRLIYGPAATFAGETIDDTAVLVRYTLYGDTDLDRDVDIGDFNRLATGFGVTAGKTWLGGDFDYDGDVDIGDFNLLAIDFGRSI